MAADDDGQLSCPLRVDTDQLSRYRVGEHEHISLVDDPALEELGKRFNDSSWQTLARHLGIDHAIPDILASGTRNPGFEALRRWRSAGDKSTVFVLRQVLVHINRRDVIKEFDRYLLNEVLLVVVLMCDGKELYNLSGTCPAKMPIIDFVRPQIYRRMAAEMVGKSCSVIRMHGHNVTWNSMARQFRGQELTLEKITTRQPGYKQQRSQVVLPSCPRSVERIGRDVISWIDGDAIYFQNSVDEQVDVHAQCTEVKVKVPREHVEDSDEQDDPSALQRPDQPVGNRANQQPDSSMHRLPEQPGQQPVIDSLCPASFLLRTDSELASLSSRRLQISQDGSHVNVPNCVPKSEDSQA